MSGRTFSSGPPLHILHVDDHAPHRRLMEDILSLGGHKSVGACSGVDALVAAEHGPFDVVLMDINMPGMSGIEVLRRLPAVSGWDRFTPVIAVTSEVIRTTQDYLDLGFSGFLPKPLTILQLTLAIDGCLQESDRRSLHRVA